MAMVRLAAWVLPGGLLEPRREGVVGAPGGAGNGGIPGNGGNGRLGAGASEALFFLPFLRPTWFTPNPVDGNAVLNLTLIGTAIKANF
jgi:hypothetical protein